MTNQEEKQEEIWEDAQTLQEEIYKLENSLDKIKNESVRKEVEKTLKKLNNKVIEMTNQARCTCDWEYGEKDPDCMACLNQWRNERYGYDVHDVECCCNDCTYGAYGYPRADY